MRDHLHTPTTSTGWGQFRVPGWGHCKLPLRIAFRMALILLQGDVLVPGAALHQVA